MNCVQCGAPFPPGGQFCNHCGAAAPAANPFGAGPAGFGPSPAMGTAPMAPGARPAETGSSRVCGNCGVIAPSQRTECSLCNASLAGAQVVPGRMDGFYWACIVECDFSCRGCGMRSPLDGLDVDGEVECRRCGMVQAFDTSQWEEALAFAEDVADGAGPPGRRPELPGSPYAQVGVSHTTVEKTLTGMVIDGGGMKPRSLRIKVSPGVPLCTRCKVPLHVEVDGAAATRTTCPRCNETAHYDVSGDVFDLNADIAGVIAEEHRTDRPPVRVTSSPGGGAVAIACPSCNAALPISDPSTTFVTCQFCRTPARIPTKSFWRATGQAPVAQRWWVLFDDASPLRNGNSDDDDDDDDDDDHDHDHDDRMDRLREAQANMNVAQNHGAPRTSSGGGGNVVGLAIAIVCVVVAGTVGFSIYTASQKKKAATSESDEKPKSKVAAKKVGEDTEEDDEKPKKPAKAAPLDRTKFQDLKGCTCKSGTDTITLAVRIDSENMGMTVGEDDGMVASFDMSWVLDSGSKGFAQIATEPSVAPFKKMKGRAMGVGVACNGDTFTAVTKDHATAWSISTKKKLWDYTLPADYTLTATPAKKGINIECATIAAPGGVIRVPMTNKKTQGIKLADGSPVK